MNKLDRDLQKAILPDAVNPAHYRHTCGIPMQTFETIRSFLTEEQWIGYCAGNALKYRLRAGKKSKNIETDINKAMWYEEKLLELLRNKEKFLRNEEEILKNEEKLLKRWRITQRKKKVL